MARTRADLEATVKAYLYADLHDAVEPSSERGGYPRPIPLPVDGTLDEQVRVVEFEDADSALVLDRTDGLLPAIDEALAAEAPDVWGA